MPNIVVLGAGVSGLTTAVLLARKPGYKITVLAKHMPGDYDIEYASPWAGANYLPMADEAGCRWEKRTWPELERLARDVPEAGIHFQDTLVLNRNKDATTSTGQWLSSLTSSTPWFQSVVPDFRVVPASEVPAGADSATAFTSVCINTAIYLPYLVSQLLSLGATFTRATLSHISDASKLHASGQPADLIVNCTGLLASKLGGVEDKTVIPVRGQILLVRNDPGVMLTVSGTDDGEDEVCYIMQRAAGGGTILGGTYQKGNWESQPDPNTALRIMKRAVELCPALTGGKGIEALDVVRHAVGLRPLRLDRPTPLNTSPPPSSFSSLHTQRPQQHHPQQATNSPNELKSFIMSVDLGNPYSEGSAWPLLGICFAVLCLLWGIIFAIKYCVKKRSREMEGIELGSIERDSLGVWGGSGGSVSAAPPAPVPRAVILDGQSVAIFRKGTQLPTSPWQLLKPSINSTSRLCDLQRLKLPGSQFSSRLFAPSQSAVMDFSDAFRLVNLGVGAFMIFSGLWHIFPFMFGKLMVGLYVALFGAITVLLEFQIPPQLSRYASFLFSFIGRGIFYIFVGCILIGPSTTTSIFGGAIALVGVAYVILEFIPSIEPPQNMREADGGWGAEQV
ncbi:hypothetical protein G7Y89_g2432 [Cudoniella acicularis]|uniref:D-amino-acid oxidase n=1 Tax=Cudoniella acicularis TaxID=354080 RepID=A0A8H4RTC3_9HELO|nr:hypothetical protein G7Y89_g2432 [Cudoniella acicularis]